MDTTVSDSRRAAASELWALGNIRARVLSDQPTLRVLCDLWRLRALVDRATGHLVQAAREEGASWAQIAEELGMSKQAAHERWRHAKEQ